MDKKKIKVCHVVSGLKAGGVESVIYNYCSRLSKEDYEFHIIYQHNPLKKNVEEFEKVGFILKRIPSKLKHPIKNYLETLRYFKENSFDVVHCHMTLTNFIPLIAAKKAKICVRICHSHEAKILPRNFLKRIFMKYMIYLCNKYATIRVACGNEAGKFLYGKNDFIVLNNAIDMKKFLFSQNSREKVRSKINVKEDEILIGHIGRFAKAKNHKFIIDLLKILVSKNSKYKLVLVGEGELMNDIKTYVKELGLEKNVIFSGVVSNANEFYSAFDIFILPSLAEGLPLVGIEAQISGLFCLFSDKIDNNVIVNHDKCSSLSLALDKWAKKIFEINENVYNRKIDLKIFSANNLNIDDEVFKLKKLYSECEKND